MRDQLLVESTTMQLDAFDDDYYGKLGRKLVNIATKITTLTIDLDELEREKRNVEFSDEGLRHAFIKKEEAKNAKREALRTITNIVKNKKPLSHRSEAPVKQCFTYNHLRL